MHSLNENQRFVAQVKQLSLPENANSLSDCLVCAEGVNYEF